jgi:hypothetical protein
MAPVRAPETRAVERGTRRAAAGLVAALALCASGRAGQPRRVSSARRAERALLGPLAGRASGATFEPMSTEKANRRTHQAQHVEKHPEEFRTDLNPNALAGQNIGADAEHPERAGQSLHDIKEAHTRFAEFSADELRRIRVAPPGSRLLQNATYIDLDDPERREFTATGEMEVGDGRLIVAKADTHYELWNRLRRVEDSYRTGTHG